MNDEKKYFGMTKMQLGILAGLVVVLILVVGTGGWLVLGDSNLGRSQRSAATVAPTVTSIVVMPSTLTPTITPTPIAYEQLIPSGWKQYKTSLIEIWLPANFKESTKKNSDILNSFSFIELLATEVSSKSSAYNMQVAVTYDLLTADSLDEHLKGKLPHLPYQARVTDSRTVYVNTVEARRFVIEYRADNVDYNDLVYVFQDGDTVWYVQYAAEISEFFTNLPMFEQSILTFRMVE
jgi:hypothetical protein